jgi:catechol 2,3-dioxygenase-like lactoylglutathione lyase family enzyme
MISSAKARLREETRAMAKIRHIAIFSDDPERLAEFYSDVYGMRVTGRSQGDVWITDGYMDVALILRKHEKAPPPGLNHFGFTLEAGEKDVVYDKMNRRGLKPFDPRANNPKSDRPFVEEAAHDPDGNRFDLSLGMRDLEAEAARRGR